MAGLSKRGVMDEGKPPKFKEEYCQLLVDHMAQGYSFESFAAKIPDNNVHHNTLYNWAKKYPSFMCAKKRGKALSIYDWEKLGRGLVSGEIKGSMVGWMFVMKCRFGYIDNHLDLSTLPTEQLVALVKKALEKVEGSASE